MYNIIIYNNIVYYDNILSITVVINFHEDRICKERGKNLTLVHSQP